MPDGLLLKTQPSDIQMNIVNKALLVVGAVVLGVQAQAEPRFQLVSGPFASWTAAKEDAEARGGHLATITSEQEWQQLTNTIGTAITDNHFWWIGASDAEPEGVWKWVTGETWSFARWAPGEPSGSGVNGKEDYVVISSQWLWLDAAHSIQFPLGYVLEYEADAFLTQGLVAYFPFDGNADDATGHGHNGTVAGAALTTDRFGQPNRAYLFGGNAAYITAPLDAAVFSNDFTASVWFNAGDYADGWPTMLQEENQSFTLSVAGDTCGCDAPGNLIASSHYPGSGHGVFSWLLVRRQQTPTAKYRQAVVTKAGTNVTMYLNSQVVASGTVSSPDTHPGSTLWIGRAVTEDVLGAYVFHGVLDDIRIYSRALSPSEVRQLYEYESGPQVDLLKAVKPALSSLRLGTNYQLQVSADLTTWTNHGTAFTATNTSMVYPQYWDVLNWNSLYFRVKQVP